LFRARQKLGKYRIDGRIAAGPQADVYRATDTIQKKRVALKIPKSADNVGHDDFVREVQIATRLDHPNILRVQDASFIDEHFVIAMELGQESLGSRIERRMSLSMAIDIADQALAGLAHAHQKKIIHCDIKPENFILFPGNQLKLADFGFAKVSLRTLKASGSGTIDYIAPEQAMGRPMFQSDVFSLGLVLYRLFSGKLPEWPFKWPLKGHDKLKARGVSTELMALLRKSIELDPQKRFRSANEMYKAFRKIRRAKSSRRKKSTTIRSRRRASDGAGSLRWRRIQWRDFQRQYRQKLDTRHECRRCDGPVAAAMQCCPWCGTDHPSRGSDTTMPAVCPRCERGVKSDWHYCAWCYGPGFEVETSRRFTDKRYTSRCSNNRCREPLMPFMRYCPWCRSKVKRNWKIEDSRQRCSGCEWGIVDEYWNYCAWCSRSVTR